MVSPIATRRTILALGLGALQAPAAALATAHAAAKDADRAAFLPVWRSFVKAVRARDAAAVAALSRFPLQRATSEGERPLPPIQKPAFAAAFRKVLAQPADEGGEDETQRTYLLREPGPEGESWDGKAVQDYGAFRFERTPAGWRLTRLLLDP